MVRTKDPVREELLAIANGLKRLRERLETLVKERLQAAETLPVDMDLPDQVDLATERRAIAECILHGLQPMIDDLRAAARYRPRRSAKRRAGRP